MKFLKYLNLQEETTAGDIASVPGILSMHSEPYPEDFENIEDADIFDDLLYVYLAYKDHDNHQELIDVLLDEYYDILDPEDSETPKASKISDDLGLHKDSENPNSIDDLTEIVIDLLDNDVDPEEILDVLDLDDNDADYTKEEYYEFLDYLDDFVEYIEDLEGTNEAVSNKFTSKSYNKKRRKFFTKSKAQFRRTKPQRKRAARTNKIARKRYYRKNKTKIKRYNQQYRKAVKSGRHIKKVRRA